MFFKKKPKYTTVQELIDHLSACDPNAPVVINSGPLVIDAAIWYYDGGYIVQDPENPSKFLSSKHDRDKWQIPDGAVNLRDWEPDSEDTLSGKPVKHFDNTPWEFLLKEEEAERQSFNGQLVNYRFIQPKVAGEAYDCIAYLESGEQGVGKCMRDAKDDLIRVYKK